MKAKTCAFIGHNDCFGLDSRRLKAEIAALIEAGVTEFLCGGMGGFDRLSAGTVHSLRDSFPQAECRLVIPYLTKKLQQAVGDYDGIIVPDFKTWHFKARIRARNRWMVDASSYAVCYVRFTRGGAAETFAYAKRKGLHIINLGEEPPR